MNGGGRKEEITFIVDSRGNRTHAVMPIELYNKLLQIQMFLEQPNARLDVKNELYYLRMKNLVATGYPFGPKTHPRFVISKGSQLKLYAVPSLNEKMADLREKLIENRTIILDPPNNCFVFDKDYEVSSPSMAAELISGSVKNGLDAWVNMQGFSLKESGFGPRHTTRRSKKDGHDY